MIQIRKIPQFNWKVIHRGVFYFVQYCADSHSNHCNLTLHRAHWEEYCMADHVRSVYHVVGDHGVLIVACTVSHILWPSVPSLPC